MRLSLLFCSAWLLLFAPGIAHPAQVRSAPKFSVKTQVDRTAVWVGEPLRYTIEIIHDRDIEFVLENLTKEQLRLDPFLVRNVEIHRGNWVPNKKVLRLNVLLSSFETGKTEVLVPALTLYYFKRDEGLGKKESAAEVLRVPATKVGLRSSLVAGQLKPRDFKPARSVNLAWAGTALALGLGGLTALAALGVRWAATVVRRQNKPKRRLSPRERERFIRQGLAKIRSLGEENPDELMRFYAEASQFLRQHLSHLVGIETQGLTPEEIEQVLKRANFNGSVAREITALLEQCDQVRYGRETLQSGSRLRSQVLESLEKVVRSP